MPSKHIISGPWTENFPSKSVLWLKYVLTQELVRNILTLQNIKSVITVL